MLFPWNVFITAEDYFHKRFCGTSVESSFENYFGIAFMIRYLNCLVARKSACSNTVGLALSVSFQHMFPTRPRVVVGVAAKAAINSCCRSLCCATAWCSC
jgi:hypothetical protein